MGQPKLKTIKRLFAVSGNRCAFPGCIATLVDSSSGKVTGRICHIKAKKPGWARYDSKQTEEERNGFDNLILMCPIHHDVIDSDVDLYTVDYLHKIKSQHEAVNTSRQKPDDSVINQFVEQEKRNDLLYTLMHELFFNANVLQDPKFKPINKLPKVPTVYPRLVSSAVEATISSGLFNESKDTELFRLLHSWREKVSEFNRRLDITEQYTFTNPTQEVLASFRTSMLKSSSILNQVRKALEEISNHLLDNYSNESGVTRKTILFGGDFNLTAQGLNSSS